MNSLQIKRQENALSQARLAEKLNVAQTTVAMWETGKRKPNIIMLKQIAAVLHCTTDELLEEIPALK